MLEYDRLVPSAPCTSASPLTPARVYLSARLHSQGLGIPVEIVFVGDDCAIPPGVDRTTGRRGLAGTILVHKIAGHVAAQVGGLLPCFVHSQLNLQLTWFMQCHHKPPIFGQGLPLAQVAEVARTVASSLGTANVALSACSLPGRPPSFTLLDDDMELGLGIHGEKGYKRTALEGVGQVAEALVNLILPQGGESGAPAGYLGDVRPDQPIALLVNSLGASTDLELGGLTLATIDALERHGFRGSLRAVLSGRLMTVEPPRSHGRCDVGADADAISAGGLMCDALVTQSLEMAGFSVTVLLLRPGMLEALEAPTMAPAWPQVAVGAQVSSRTYLEKPAIAVLASATDISERYGVAGTMLRVALSR